MPNGDPAFLSRQAPAEPDAWETYPWGGQEERPMRRQGPAAVTTLARRLMARERLRARRGAPLAFPFQRPRGRPVQAMGREPLASSEV
ncbi:MAG: hypothetical protein HY535_02065 [Chloroflexi bacterium]|nr:hypothetical protein [Chloroflexota bacterium]